MEEELEDFERKAFLMGDLDLVILLLEEKPE